MTLQLQRLLVTMAAVAAVCMVLIAQVAHGQQSQREARDELFTPELSEIDKFAYAETYEEEKANDSTSSNTMDMKATDLFENARFNDEYYKEFTDSYNERHRAHSLGIDAERSAERRLRNEIERSRANATPTQLPADFATRYSRSRYGWPSATPYGSGYYYWDGDYRSRYDRDYLGYNYRYPNTDRYFHNNYGSRYRSSEDRSSSDRESTPQDADVERQALQSRALDAEEPEPTEVKAERSSEDADRDSSERVRVRSLDGSSRSEAGDPE